MRGIQSAGTTLACKLESFELSAAMNVNSLSLSLVARLLFPFMLARLDHAGE